MTNETKLKVIIEVSGGVAECIQCPDGVEVEIVDWDNIQEEQAEISPIIERIKP